MIRRPLPFVVKKDKPKKPDLPENKQWTQRRARMTLVTALIGQEGTVLFSDSQETVGGLTKKRIDKLCVWDFAGRPFRFWIAGAADDATYVDTLQSELSKSLLALNDFDLPAIQDALSNTLAEFYGKHIWPQGSKKPSIEYLLVVQPIPKGQPETFHISESAVNVIGESRNIGIGAYLADYLTECLGYAESIEHLIAAAAYISKEVQEYVEGIGSVERLAIFLADGTYEEIGGSYLPELEDRVTQLRYLLSTAIGVAADAPATSQSSERLIRMIVDGFRNDFKQWRGNVARYGSGRIAKWRSA